MRIRIYKRNGDVISADYQTRKNNSKTCLYCQWAPAKRRKQKVVTALLKQWFNVYTFDYSGWWNSDGNFIPSEVFFSAQDMFDFIKQKHGEDTICIWHSFWSIVAGEIEWVEKLILLAPVLIPRLFGLDTDKKEDSIQDFLHGLKEYEQYYSGIDYQLRQEFLEQYQRTPKSALTTIIHGKRDRSIHFSRTQKHVENLSNVSVLYPWYVGHSGISLIEKIPDIILQ